MAKKNSTITSTEEGDFATFIIKAMRELADEIEADPRVLAHWEMQQDPWDTPLRQRTLLVRRYIPSPPGQEEGPG